MIPKYLTTAIPTFYCFEWCSWFKNSVTSVEIAKCPGHPSTSKADENVD
jgi:hypothetical protein